MAYTISITNITKNEGLLEVDVLFQDGATQVTREYKLARNDLDLVNFKRTLLEQKLALEEIDEATTATGEVDLTDVTLTPPDPAFAIFEKKMLRLIKIQKLIDWEILPAGNQQVINYVADLKTDLASVGLATIAVYLDQIDF